jgi:GNAT superfamily N-acetyltransferase
VNERHAVADDLPGIEHALAVAFADDPMITWVSGEADRDRRIAAGAAGFFRPAVAAGLVRGHTYTVDATSALGGAHRSAGAAVWSPPDVRMFRDDEATALGMAVAEHLGQAALERLMALGDMVGSRHPADVPHFYLFLLGAAEQGRGVGARLVQPVLRRCDTDGLPAYLESSSAKNVSFYERLGFRVLWSARPAPDAPEFRGMWRDPQR